MKTITLNISKKTIEIEDPTEVIEQYHKDFYTYPEHEYELNLDKGEKTDNKLREDLLEDVFKNSKNDVLLEVLKKVTLLDNFYRTRIPKNNIVPIARHIVYLEIDKYLYTNPINTDLVNKIAYQQTKYKTKDFKTDKEVYKDLQIKINHVYSFASKYCSWHNSEYPIADSYSKGMLYYINKAEAFYKDDKNELPSKSSLNDYKVFFDMYMAFKKTYFDGMSDITNKVIDTYLWKYAQNKISYLKSKNLTCNISKKDSENDKRLFDYIKLDSNIPSYLKKQYKIS